MFDDGSLHSKYVRLGSEFKKLRERYRIMRENLKDSFNRTAQLESKLSAQLVHTRNLELEKEILICKNQRLLKQVTFLENQLEFANQNHPSVPNGCSVESRSPDDALKRALQEVNNLHEELVLQSSKFLARLAELESSNPPPKLACVPASVQTSSPNLSLLTQSSSPVDANSSSLDALCLQDPGREDIGSTDKVSINSHAFTHNETKRKSPTGSPDHNAETVNLDSGLRSQVFCRKLSLSERAIDFLDSQKELTPRENLLLKRISQLESKVAEISLQQRLQTRRTQLTQQTLSITEPLSSTAISSESSDASVKEELLVEYYEKELFDRTRQLTVYAGRVTDAYEEIKSLHEHLRSVLRDLEKHRREAMAATARADNLEEELKSMKQRTAQQLTEMAIHLATLTDDIHTLRGKSDGDPFTTSSTSKVDFLSLKSIFVVGF